MSAALQTSPDAQGPSIANLHSAAVADAMGRLSGPSSAEMAQRSLATIDKGLTRISYLLEAATKLLPIDCDASVPEALLESADAELDRLSAQCRQVQLLVDHLNELCSAYGVAQ